MIKTCLKLFVIITLTLPLSGCASLFFSSLVTGSTIVAQERSIPNAIDDMTIWTEIKNEYLQNDVNDLLSNVNVEVIEQRVYLTGNVPDAQSRIDAVRLAWKANGVKEVINELTLKDGKELKNIALDSWITTQVKGRMLMAANVRSVNYTVETINQTVYLMGIAKSREELEKVATEISKVKGVKKVISHVRVKEASVEEESNNQT